MPTSAAPTLLDRLAAAASDLERLRLLDLRSRELRRLGRAELGRIAELFPEGWRRRRALEAMARAGTPTPDLLALLAAVGKPGVAAWVLATLAQRGDLDVDEVAGDSPSLQRRLRLRRQRREHR